MEQGRADRKPMKLFLIFVLLAALFSLFGKYVLQLDGWLLAFFNEGRVTSGAVSVSEGSPATPVEHPRLTLSKTTTPAKPKPAATPDPKEIMELVVPWDGSIPVNAITSKPDGRNFPYKWTLIGPFRLSSPEDRKSNYCMVDSVNIQFMPDEGNLDTKTLPPEGKPKWFAVNVMSFSGRINFGELFPDTEYAVIYGVSIIESPEQLDNLRMLTGSDDYLKVWINGKLVHTYNEQCRPAKVDSDITQGITLMKGRNKVVFKCVDITQGWEMFLRFIDKIGNSTKFE